MRSDRCPQVELHHKTPDPPPHRPGRDFLRRWFVANSLVGGFLALCWLLLRSGPRPSRFAYAQSLISIGDVLAVVKAFVGEPYPGSDPFGCP
jgi:hypothetical protein